MKTSEDKNLLKRLKDIMRNSGKSFGNPLFVWKLILGFFSIGFVGLALFGTVLFLRVQKEDFQDGTTMVAPQITGIKIKQLINTISYFDDKEVQFQNALNSNDKAVDPSL